MTEALRMVVALNLQVAALRALADLDAAAGLSALLAAAGPTEIANGIYERRRVALYGLGNTGLRAAAELLAGPGGLGSSDWRLRATAARALAVLGFDDALERLLPHLDDDSDEVRRMVAEVLGLMGDARAVEPLIARLGDGNGALRKKTALSLRYLWDARARDALAALRDSDGSASVRRAAAYAEGLLAGSD